MTDNIQEEAEMAWDHSQKPAVRREVSHYHIIFNRDNSSHARKGDVVGKAKNAKSARKVVDRKDNEYGAYAHSVKPVFKEEVEMNDIKIISEEILEDAAIPTGNKGTDYTNAGKAYGPKKLSDITTGSGGQDEWKGNTPREADIIAQNKRNTVKYPDVAGNGDDVFSGTRIKRAPFAVKPGDDVSAWDASFNKGPKLLGPSLKEYYENAVAPVLTAGRQIYPHDIENHWATVHAAPKGSHISGKDDGTTTIHHPDGSQHHIAGGEIPQKSMKYNGKDEKGKFNVVVNRSSEKGGSGFVSNKKALKFGYVNTTTDESEAKDFHSAAHAQNHINLHSQFTTDTYMSAYPKRSAKTIKSDKDNYSKAAKDHTTAFTSAVKAGRDPDSDIKVRVAKRKMYKSKHPGMNW